MHADKVGNQKGSRPREENGIAGADTPGHGMPS
jgi:hypothetical protein